jgi:4-hydroxybenzoate polyprenyltransferase
MMASSVYLLNDLVDLPSDRQHPRKRNRPFAAGEIPIAHGILISGGLILLSLLLAGLVLPPLFLAVLLGYFAATLAYSFALKRKLIVDVVTLAGLYTLRIIAGGAAVAIMPSPWLLAFSVFLFFSLAAIKRQAELVDQIKAGKDASPGRAYLSSDVAVVQIMAVCAGQAAVLVFALYIDSPAVAALYARPAILWLLCPVLLYWLSRIALLTHRGHMDDDPIVFAARDRISQITVVCAALILFAAEL